MIPENRLEELARDLIPAVRRAGAEIMAVSRKAGMKTRKKSDSSPVTEADEKAEVIVLEALSKIAPEVPVVAEEHTARHGLPDEQKRQFFLVDPLDGTKEFLRGGSDFTVNVALVQDGAPVLGVVSAPAREALWFGTAADGAFKLEGTAKRPGRIGVRKAAPGQLAIVASRSHRSPNLEAWLAHFPHAAHVSIGSSLKFCLVAEGKADLYPRLGPTMEWDTAAGDAVLRAAGGEVLDADGTTLPYNKPGYRNGHFIARGDSRVGYPPID